MSMKLMKYSDGHNSPEQSTNISEGHTSSTCDEKQAN
jgi:hypothetical protein